MVSGPLFWTNTSLTTRMVFLNTLRLYILFIIIVHTLASFRPYANFRQSPTIKEPKTKYKVSPTLKYHYNFGKTINLNPLKKLRRRREDDDSPIEGIAEDDHSSLAIPHDPSPPPLASLHPLVDSVALRLTRLLTGGTSRFVDTEFDVGEEAKSERVKAPVHIIDIKGQGKLPPIVLLHGITSCSADFAPLALELRSKFSRIIAIDLLGHGLTPLPNTLEKPHFSWMTKVVSQVLDKCLPDQKAIILGNSMGGLVAMRTALERPDIGAGEGRGERCDSCTPQSVASNHAPPPFPPAVDGLFLISPAGGPLNEKQIDSLTSIFHISSHEEGKEFIDRMHGQKPFTPLLHLMAWVARGRVNKDSGG